MENSVYTQPRWSFGGLPFPPRDMNIVCLLFYTVLRPHLGLAGPAKAPSVLRLMQLQTSNSYYPRWNMEVAYPHPHPRTWHHHSLRLCHAVSLSAPTSYPISASIATPKVWLPIALQILLALGSGSGSN
ncbi:uncharacterized protein BDZ83DRAFT_648701 [Colletotrichum acutatum]|uniref:Uncharacterized protein n=1 Tax=Glomerella acutata TaxID=27357 RepID=A0AAD8UWN0_GLOAC|nr:uncharacterized protein BDZ83DRAFT_648701 [Colletotrichum acutatum]KAK1728439.1 hypothetical protein BDZ83DRAFT_648701 [Colletotrichum acutatum]